MHDALSMVCHARAHEYIVRGTGRWIRIIRGEGNGSGSLLNPGEVV